MLTVADLDPHRIPRHVAIIMDGNGRWARERHLPRVVGHKVGSESVKKIVNAAKDLGISYLTMYAFSTENWQRPAMEVQALMALLKTYLRGELRTMLRNRVRFFCLGRMEGFSEDVQEVLRQVIRETGENAGDNPRLTLNLALNYGGRDEIVRAVQMLAEKCVQGALQPQEITEELISANLYSAGQPDPDLVIRTGGESRLSNFLLWQTSYAEIYITETKWPEFRKDSLIAAVYDYQNRERRFGKTGEQIRQG